MLDINVRDLAVICRRSSRQAIGEDPRGRENKFIRKPGIFMHFYHLYISFIKGAAELIQTAGCLKKIFF